MRADLTPKDEPRVVSAWSIDTLYVHLSRLIEDVAKRTEQHFELNEQRYLAERQTVNVAIKAVEETARAALLAAKEESQKTERVTEVRFAGVNEWRSTVQDLIGQAIPRKEVETRDAATSEKIADITARIGSLESMGLGRQEKGGEVRANWNMVFAVIAAIGILFGIVMAFKK